MIYMLLLTLVWGSCSITRVPHPRWSSSVTHYRRHRCAACEHHIVCSVLGFFRMSLTVVTDPKHANPLFSPPLTQRTLERKMAQKERLLFSCSATDLKTAENSDGESGFPPTLVLGLSWFLCGCIFIGHFSAVTLALELNSEPAEPH